MFAIAIFHQRRRPLFTLCAAAFVMCVLTSDVSLAVVHEGHDARELAELQQAAATGDVEAMTALGWRYYNGVGIQVDRAQAEKQWTAAAEAGNARAMARLGQPRPHADAANREYPARVDWLEKAAERGDPLGVISLGVAHLFGQGGLPKDSEAGIALIRQAAEDDSVMAQLLLAGLYHEGKAVAHDPEAAEQWAKRALTLAEAHPDRLGPEDYAALGGFSFRGIVLPADGPQALRWWQAGAKTGDPVCAFGVGGIYLIGGDGIAPDPAKAAEWLNRAHQGKYAHASKMLAVLYLNGRGVPQDSARAADLVREAADANDPEAMRLLGLMYDKGTGVEQDRQEAVAWLTRSAEAGDATAMFVLARLYGEGEKQDHDKLLVWLTKAADRGHVEAMANLGAIYLAGEIGPVDHAQALKWTRRAAEAGSATAMNNLGKIYAEGIGVQADLDAAVGWYRQAAERGSINAMSNLGTALVHGQDPGEGIRWLMKAAEAGDIKAMNNLGTAYMAGIGVEPDRAKGRQWFTRAAQAGSADGMHNLALIYLKGAGVEADREKATEWMQRAAEAGNADAQRWLDRQDQ